MDGPVLRTDADPGDSAYQRYLKEHTAVVEDLRARMAQTRLGGPEKARVRHVERGKLLPRDRVDALIDRGSPFLELSALAAHGLYDDEAPSAGINPGGGGVKGRECGIGAKDAQGKGGTLHPVPRCPPRSWAAVSCTRAPPASPTTWPSTTRTRCASCGRSSAPSARASRARGRSRRQRPRWSTPTSSTAWSRPTAARRTTCAK